MNRVFHPYHLWEEVKFGMYESPKNKEQESQVVIQFFNNPSDVLSAMCRVIETCPYACEHNFTNPTMNKIAWLRQASVALKYQISEESTRDAWNYLTEEVQIQANKIAENCIKKWGESYAKKI
jgi:hypothetical protein